MPYVRFQNPRTAKEEWGEVSLRYVGDDLHIRIGRTVRTIPAWREAGIEYLGKLIGKEIEKPPVPKLTPVYVTTPTTIRFINLRGDETIEPVTSLEVTEDTFKAFVNGNITVDLPLRNLIAIERATP